jgi:hypothetical protein
MTGFVIGFVFMACLMNSLLRFDRIIKWIHDNHRTTWDQMGKPIGSFWGPPVPPTFRGLIARERQRYIMLFRTPDPLRNVTDMRSAMNNFRISECLTTLIAIPLLIYFVMEMK